MGTQSTNPKWWTAEHHETLWQRAMDVLRRDWADTKAGLGLEKKKELPRPWADVEGPLRYGVGARAEYKRPWREVEHVLRGEWAQFALGDDWEDVKEQVRLGYEHEERPR